MSLQIERIFSSRYSINFYRRRWVNVDFRIGLLIVSSLTFLMPRRQVYSANKVGTDLKLPSIQLSRGVVPAREYRNILYLLITCLLLDMYKSPLLSRKLQLKDNKISINSCIFNITRTGLYISVPRSHGLGWSDTWELLFTLVLDLLFSF